MKKREFFKIENNKIIRMRKHCPKCGPAVFLAEHKNRLGCGKCGYTEFKGGRGKQPQSPKTEENSIKQPLQKLPETASEASKEGPKDEITMHSTETIVREPSEEDKQVETIKEFTEESKANMQPPKKEKPTEVTKKKESPDLDHQLSKEEKKEEKIEKSQEE